MCSASMWWHGQLESDLISEETHLQRCPSCLPAAFLAGDVSAFVLQRSLRPLHTAIARSTEVQKYTVL
jgi:hypothetical protein